MGKGRKVGEVEMKEAYEKAHIDYPFKIKYKNKPEDCVHNYSFVVFCDNHIDIVRCQNCGSEIERSCNFDDDYS